VPAAKPLMTPDVGLIEATLGLPLLKEPPPTVLLKVVLPPMQIACPPLRVPALGGAVTVTATVCVAFVPQPLLAVTVYVPVAAVVAFVMLGVAPVAENEFGPAQE
jgi:hypothetical protein